jgi:hypothetical protein
MSMSALYSQTVCSCLVSNARSVGHKHIMVNYISPTGIIKELFQTNITNTG